MISHWIALLLAVAANIAANVAFKAGVQDLGFSGRSLWAAAQNPWLWTGFVSAAVLLGCYLYAIRGIALSVAYPVITGLAMVGIALVAALLLGEPLGSRKMVGTAFVIAGVAILSQTAQGS